LIFSNLVDANLNTDFIGRNLEYYSRLASTNDEAWELISENVPNGSLIIADNQFKGRGRFGKKWISAPSMGLTFSLILYDLKNLHRLPLIIGVSVCEALKGFNFKLKLKWPNDIILNDKKIGGILCESKNINNVKTIVVGIGMNINEKADDFPDNLRKRAISLSMVSNKTFQRERVLAKILNQFEKNLDLLGEKNLELFKKWESFCNHIDKEVTFHNNNVNVVGKFLKISDKGSAIIEVNNKEKTFSSGIVEINNSI
tara:strand:+ start:361 stop:1131 length:771 start_codon:yes stop_codon:yes gene_type:complete